MLPSFFQRITRALILRRSTSSLDALLALGLTILPLFHLTLKSWTNGWLAVLGGLALVHLWEQHSATKPIFADWQTKAITAALTAPLVGVIIAQVLRQNLYWKALDGPSRMALAGLVFLVLRHKRVQFLKVFRWICPISILICFVSILLFHAGTEHWGGRFATYFVDCDAFGQHIVLLGFLGFMMFQMEDNSSRVLRCLDLGAVACATYLALGSQTRGAWIALVPLSLLWIAFLRENPRRILYTALAAVALLGGILVLDIAVRERMLSIYHELNGWWTGQNVDTSGGLRLSMWKITLALFKHSPLYGYGEYAQFKHVLQEPFITSIASETARSTIDNGPHNQVAAEVLRSGIFGLLYSMGLFVIPGWIFILNLRSHLRSSRLAAILGLCVVVAFAVFSLTLEVFNMKFAASFYGFLIAALAAQSLGDRDAIVLMQCGEVASPPEVSGSSQGKVC